MKSHKNSKTSFKKVLHDVKPVVAKNDHAMPNMIIYDSSIFIDKSNQKKQKSEAERDFENLTDINDDKIWSLLDKLKLESMTNMSDVMSESEYSATDTESESPEKEERTELDNDCQTCGSEQSLIKDFSRGAIVCNMCGVISEGIIDYSLEKPCYNSDNPKTENTRCSGPSNFFAPKSSLSSTISGVGSSRIKKIQKWNSNDATERNLNKILEDIGERCTIHKIPGIAISAAKNMYYIISRCKHQSGQNKGKKIIIRNPNRQNVKAACVFYACVKNKIAKSTEDIAKIFDLVPENITRGIKYIYRIINSCEDRVLFEFFEDNNAENFINRFSTRMKMNKDLTDTACRLAMNASRLKIVAENTPQAIAAASIVLLGDIEKKYEVPPRSDLSKMFDVSSITINKTYKKLCDFKNILNDTDAVNYILDKNHVNMI